MKHLPQVMAVATLMTLASLPVVGDERLDLIRNGNRSSREAIRTLHVKFESVEKTLMKNDGKEVAPVHITMEWWQDGSRIRWSRRDHLRSGDKSDRPQVLEGNAVVKDGELVRIDAQNIISRRDSKVVNEVRHATIQTYKASDPWIDVWSQALFVVVKDPRHTADQLLERADNVKESKTELLLGTPHHKLTVGSPNKGSKGLDLWFDPRHNFLVRKVGTISAEDDPWRVEREVLQFSEPRPGIYFPKAVNTRLHHRPKGKPEILFKTAHLTFVHVAINEPIDPKVFDLTIPAGMSVQDIRKGIVYTMGPDGKPSGKVYPAPAPPPPPPGTEAKNVDQGWWTMSVWGGGLMASVLLGLLGTIYLSRARNRPQ